MVIEDVTDDTIDFVSFDGRRVGREVRRHVEDVTVDDHVIFEFSDLVPAVAFQERSILDLETVECLLRHGR